MLRIRELTKTFPESLRNGTSTMALDHVDLDVGQGQFATVLGPSGCGKTTLLRSIAGFEKPDHGSVAINGRTVVDSGGRWVPTHDRGVGIVPQDGALFPHLTVGGNIAFGLTTRRSERRHRVREVLELVGMSGMESRRPHELSGGQQQRVALARAMAPNPRIILLDEPFSALDAKLRQSLRDDVRDILTGIGATAVLVTHDQAEALALADHLVVMRHGRVVQAGSPRDTYLHPRDIELARFLGEAVVVPGRRDNTGTVTCVFGTLPVASTGGATGACDVLIRPENIRVSPAADASGVVGTVTGESFYGHDQMLQVDVAALAHRVQVRVIGTSRFKAGDPVELRVADPVQTFVC